MKTIFHVIILFSPIASTFTGYLISTRKDLFVETKRSEQQLKIASSEWRSTFDSMPYGVMVTDEKHNIIRANQFIATCAGKPVKQLVFKNKCYEILFKSNNPCDDCPLSWTVKTNVKQSVERYEPASNRYYVETVSPMFDADSNVTAFIHSIIDVTESKEKEKRLIESKDAFFNMLKDLDNTYKEMKDVYNNLVIAFSNVIDAKSPWTKGHSVNVAKHAEAIARAMELPEDDVYVLRTAALLHDIGKIGTYDSILDKKGKLTEEEFALVKEHPSKGERILRPIKGLESVLPVIRHHHEKLDGTGYPDQLKGNEISLLARILCVADSYDSMVSSRPYRTSRGREFAIEELRRCAGTQFDPLVVETFIGVVQRETEKTVQ
jgi:putative nucleotidyltransferase with HDIG domain/PAS domain S-box-containing protein